jgi:hypothetical protein
MRQPSIELPNCGCGHCSPTSVAYDIGVPRDGGTITGLARAQQPGVSGDTCVRVEEALARANKAATAARTVSMIGVLCNRGDGCKCPGHYLASRFEKPICGC